MTSKGWTTLMNLKTEIEKGENLEIPVNVVRTLIMRDVGLDDRTICLYIKRLRGLRVLGDCENPNYFRVVANDKGYESDNYVLSKQESDLLDASSVGGSKEVQRKKKGNGDELRPCSGLTKKTEGTSSGGRDATRGSSGGKE